LKDGLAYRADLSGLAYLGDLSGPEYAWLGHFRSPEILAAGHNDDDAEQVDDMVQNLEADRMPNSISSSAQGA
jgi:hypothetical protein